MRTTQNGDFVLLPFGVSRLVGAVAPERVVASFLGSRLVSCTCALLWMSILNHATALKPFHSKQSYPLHHLQHNNFDCHWSPLVPTLDFLSTLSTTKMGPFVRTSPSSGHFLRVKIGNSAQFYEMRGKRWTVIGWYGAVRLMLVWTSFTR